MLLFDCLPERPFLVISTQRFNFIHHATLLLLIQYYCNTNNNKFDMFFITKAITLTRRVCQYYYSSVVCTPSWCVSSFAVLGISPPATTHPRPEHILGRQAGPLSMAFRVQHAGPHDGLLVVLLFYNSSRAQC